MTDIERDYKGDSNCLQAVIKQLPHSDNPSLKYKELLKACRSGRVFSAIGGTSTHDQGCMKLPMVAHMQKCRRRGTGGRSPLHSLRRGA